MVNVNLAEIPSCWGDYQGNIIYGTGPQITSLDYNVVRTPGKPSMRIDPHTPADMNTAREIDGVWYPIKAGDVVKSSCWMKASTNSSTYGYPQSGARYGFDFYGRPVGGGTWHLIDAMLFWFGPNYSGGVWSSVEAMYVTNSGDGWQQKTLDFTVPTTLFDSTLNVSCIPDYIVMWVQGMPTSGTTQSTVWFADPEMYINPTTQPIPTDNIFNFAARYQQGNINLQMTKL